MLSWNEIQDNAIKFSKRWEHTTYEKGEAQSFLNELFRVFGVDRLRVANFEYRSRQGFIDLFWKGRIIIEMKSAGHSLEKAHRQARDYAFSIEDDEDLPKMIMVCDFRDIRLYNLVTGQTFNFQTKQLFKHVKKLTILTDYAQQYNFVVDKELNNQAVEKMAQLHDLLEGHGYEGHYLKMYLVRLLFLLFADHSNIFEKGLFYQYILKSKSDGSDLSNRIFNLFNILNMSYDTRKKRDLIPDELKRFVYVNGKLFEETLPPCEFNAKMRDLLIDCCLFDWSTISPAIFGSLFQGVTNKKERRNLGTYYTSEENILKLLKPLFLDELYEEFEKVKMFSDQLKSFHKKIANLKFLDPACGCGNFLIITYRELRLLELEILKMQINSFESSFSIEERIKINVDQFIGIEYEEFPCKIAEVAMWLIDHQMNNLIADEFGIPFNRLPLKNSVRIVNNNALTIEWEEIISKNNLSYIIGNPPFVGTKYQSSIQKEDLQYVFKSSNKIGVLDYVSAWYLKAIKYIQHTEIRVAFVSTNSITQGEQVAVLWRYLFKYKINILFAYRTFNWKNDAKGKASVHCVIIGFKFGKFKGEKVIFFNGYQKIVKNISPYLIESENIYIEKRRKPICDCAPIMNKGSQPTDGGNLILSESEKKELLKREPGIEKYIRQYMGAADYINGKKRWCLWLVGCTPKELKQMPSILTRIENVKKSRLSSKKKSTQIKASIPMLFTEIRQPENDYLLIPVISSEKRPYIPIGFVDKNIIANTNAQMIPNATFYHFGVISSKVHMCWVKTVCGRMKSDYAYSVSIVYNNFPWPAPNEKIITNVEKCVREVLNARNLYLDNTLADLYDPLTMPPELVKAHIKLDNSVMDAYGYKHSMDELEIVEDLMRRYKNTVNDKE
ncbi:hypothetical protein J2S74_001303 [Evansella vedderi]|uniref:site-specific DNA-methyltransferase (adenine-specific) n=1 Tax=Evansella vedderi TaxID=38282 RepID=A0ABT9ZUW6_9BACI|nr:DNA methyltransferase [Evansella vedderi]MDQ0253930.1 hypothetical protein [Evansella vedderi]